jgi:hypothetical protein
MDKEYVLELAILAEVSSVCLLVMKLQETAHIHLLALLVTMDSSAQQYLNAMHRDSVSVLGILALKMLNVPLSAMKPIATVSTQKVLLVMTAILAQKINVMEQVIVLDQDNVQQAQELQALLAVELLPPLLLC